MTLPDAEGRPVTQRPIMGRELLRDARNVAEEAYPSAPGQGVQQNAARDTYHALHDVLQQGSIRQKVSDAKMNNQILMENSYMDDVYGRERPQGIEIPPERRALASTYADLEAPTRERLRQSETAKGADFFGGALDSSKPAAARIESRDRIRGLRPSEFQDGNIDDLMRINEARLAWAAVNPRNAGIVQNTLSELEGVPGLLNSAERYLRFVPVTLGATGAATRGIANAVLERPALLRYLNRDKKENRT
jgi:hypothetical protein